jgi:hypothetical protein
MDTCSFKTYEGLGKMSLPFASTALVWFGMRKVYEMLRVPFIPSRRGCLGGVLLTVPQPVIAESGAGVLLHVCPPFSPFVVASTSMISFQSSGCIPLVFKNRFRNHAHTHSNTEYNLKKAFYQVLHNPLVEQG